MNGEFLLPLRKISFRERLSALFLDVLSWRLVRAYGALTVLTRASYVMLVLVPLLAGVWPVVQTGIDGSREALLRHADNITKSSERLSGQLQTQLENADNIVSIARSIAAANKDSTADTDSAPTFKEEQRFSDLLKVNSKLADDARGLSERLHNLASSLPQAMPSAWAFAFFAALAVALGQVLYQTSAPEIVRRHTLEEYQEARVNPGGRDLTSDEINRAELTIRNAEFKEGTFLNQKLVACFRAVYQCHYHFEFVLTGSGYNTRDGYTSDDMKAAAESEQVQPVIHRVREALAGLGLFYARECLELAQERNRFAECKNLVGPLPGDIYGYLHNHQIEDTRPKQYKTLEYLVRHHLNPAFDVDDDAAHNREKVWIGARVEYLDECRLRARGRCFVSLTFYGIASALIAWITYTQAKSVAQAVGWLQ
jgi:hypothetical protein